MGSYAAVDCGTLSTRLLIKDAGGATLLRLAKITGLGKGVDATGALARPAVERALEVLRQYRELMDRHGVGAATMVGTSALRDASNRESFSCSAETVVGARLRLLSGEEEALLSFRGATAELGAGTGPWLVADIGGGSTELVVGPEPFAARSLDLGCVRVTERFLAHDPPAEGELAAAQQWLAGQFDQVRADVPELSAARALVGLAGTVAALACFDQGLSTYRRQAVHHYRLTRPAVEGALRRLAAEPAARRAELPGIEAARAPFVVGGTVVLSTLMAAFGFEECLVSESDILDGLVSELALAEPAAGAAS
ncbi:MAG: exopolyphosphatase [Acidimicrobiales bacterium]